MQNATFWQPYSSLNFDDYTKQGSFFFNTTAFKTHAPTDDQSWMYLVVEQGTFDRVTQTAWYDTKDAAKITYKRQYDGTWSDWYANDNDSVTSIFQTNSNVRQEIEDRKNGDSNTLQSAKDFTQSTITSYDKGIQSQFTQTSAAILAKVGATNLFPNSEFKKDYGYRQKDGNTSLSLDNKDNVDGRYNGTVQVISTSNNYQGYWTRNIPVYGGQKYSMSVLVHYENGGLSNGWASLDIWFVDKDGNRISAGYGGNSANNTGQVGSPWWVKLYAEGITAPTNAVSVQVSLIVNNAGAGQTATFTQPMVTATEKLHEYTPNDDISSQLSLFKDNWYIGLADNIGNITSGIIGDSGSMSLISNNITLDGNTTFTALKKTVNDNDSAVSQVKNTADSISNFVRDSSGNISSDFQTALSKTSIITGSTLASSIQKQTSSQISSALTDNNGKIISLINQDSSGVQIAGKNIVLDGDTTVTGDFYAKGGNFKNLNASNLTVGTLNGNQVNITNINANNIVSGAISGANLNINLNTGSVVFQKGRINSSDYTTDINIDQGYISTANDNTRALIKQGMIQLVAPNRFDLDSSPYMEISNNRGQNTAGAAIVGRDSVSIANSKNAKNIFPTPLGEETFSGLYTGQAFDGGWLPTKVAGANRGVVVAGGTETTWQVVNNSPYIFVGTDAGGSYSYGNRVAIQAEYLHAETVYYHYASGGGNVYISSDGALLKSSSATKYKTNIEHETDSIQGDQLLTIDPATWNDKFEAEQLERYHEIGVEPERQINMEGKRYYGIIAEDLVKAGLEELVTRNEETDEVEGVEYSKIGVALIPIVRDLRNRLNEQYVEIERLKDKIK